MPRRRQDPDPIAAAFGDAVKRHREQRGESLEALADRIPGRRPKTGEAITMDGRYLGEIERGWHTPSIVTAKRIADALGISLSTLTEGL